jgi:transporter family protein
MERHGLLFALLAAFLWGLAPVFEKLGLIRISPLAGIAIRNIAITIILLIIVFLTNVGKELLHVDLKSVVFVVIGGIIAGLLGMWSYFEALKHWEASRVVPIAGAYPLLAFIFSILFLGENLTLQKGIGVILIVSGVFLLG